MIICLSGSKRAGKDVTADVFVRSHNFIKISLATPIRQLCSNVFHLPLNIFTDDNLKEKEFTHPILLNATDIGHIFELVESSWGIKIPNNIMTDVSNLIGTPLSNPRRILQVIGTDLLRNNIDNDIFLKLADKQIKNTDKNVVIADCRFSNEREWFKKQDATLCLIKRPEIIFNDSHISENDLGEEKDYDVIMLNNGTLSGFQVEIGLWINCKLNNQG